MTNLIKNGIGIIKVVTGVKPPEKMR